MSSKMEGGRIGFGDFDFVGFFKKPQTILRIVSIVFAIVVFGCISAGGYDHNANHCVFNKDLAACQYGIAIGVLAFLGCLVFLASDAHFINVVAAGVRRVLIMVDLGFSGFWCFLWFIGFCYLADMWRKTVGETNQFETNHARATIAFSFFSVFTWGGLAVMAFMRFQQGSADFDYGGKNFPGEGASPYASFPSPGDDSDNQGFNPQPFANQPSNNPEYAPPY